MDYSKVGSRLMGSVFKSEARLGKTLHDVSLPISITPRALNECDSIIIQNRDALKKLYDGKPLKVVVSELNDFGEVCHNFQGLYEYKKYTDSAQNMETFFKDLKIKGLFDVYKKDGINGLYTYFLNQASSGSSVSEFKKLQELILKEQQKLGIDSPNVGIWLKKIIKKSDFDFLPWKTKGFVMPQETKIKPFSDEAYNATRQYNINSRLDDRVPNGFCDGGRSLEFDKSGKYSSGYTQYREIAVVDKANDKILNDTIKQLREVFDRNPYMTYDERVKTLYTFVNEIYRVKNSAAKANELLAIPMKLGDIISSGAGVCRQKSLTAKVLADEVGLNMSIVRGCHKSDAGSVGNHIWNEVTLPDGKKYLFDTAQMSLIDFDSKNAALDRYYSDTGVKLYN